MISFYMPDLKLIIPEGILVLSALCILMEGVFRKTGSSASFRRFNHYGIIALFIALVVLVIQHTSGEKWVTFEGQILQDDFIYFAKVLILIGSMAVLAISLPSMMKEHIVSFEYSPLILFATVGMLLMVEANDFMTLLWGLRCRGCLFIFSQP